MSFLTVLVNTTVSGSTTPAFASQQTFVTGSLPISLAVADLNGDGKPELISASNYNTVSTLINTTAPGATVLTFASHVDFATGAFPHSVAVADFNGDGKPDLVVADGHAGKVSVLLNNTTPGATAASFAPKVDFNAGGNPFSVAVADFNGDGKPDIALADGPSPVAVLLNTTTTGAATPTFAAPASFGPGGAFFLTVADLNGDGKPDIVAAPRGYAASALMNTTVTGATTPTFTAAASFATNYTYTEAVADFNGDGLPDLVTTSSGVGPSAGKISVLLNTTVLGAATILPAFPASGVASVVASTSVAVGDLNGDGRPDLVVAGGKQVAVLLNTTTPGAATATFGAPLDVATTYSVNSVAIGDLNGDGKADVVFTEFGTPVVGVLLNTTAPGATTPSFAPEVDFATRYGPHAVAIADLNGDGMPDLVVADAQASVGGAFISVLLNRTAPGAAVPVFDPHVDFYAGITTTTSVAIADFCTSDGRLTLR